MKQKIKISNLRNGSLLISEEMPHLNSSIMGIYVRMGSDFEPSNLNGISHLVEHMLFKGTKNRNAKDIAREIESLGGIFNAYTSRDHTCYYFKALPRVMKRIYDIFEDIVFNSVIPEDELIKEKRVILEELKASYDDPQDLIFQNLNALIFKDTQYAKTILGTKESIEGIQRNNVLKFMNEYYTNENVFFAYAGPQSHSEIKKLIEVKNDYRNTKKIKHLKRIKNNNALKKYIYKSSLSQLHVAMGIKTVKYDSNDRYPLLLLTSILGTGMSSRLFIKLREDHGYVYSVFTFLESFWDSGMLGVYFASDLNNYSKTKSLIEREFNDIKKGNITEKEIEKVKTQIISSSMISFDTMSGRIGLLARSVLYKNRIMRLNEVIKNIKSITKEDIIDCANKYLHMEDFNIVAIGNKKTMRL